AMGAMLKAVAQLIAQRAGVDLKFLYGEPTRVAAHQPEKDGSQKFLTLSVGWRPPQPEPNRDSNGKGNANGNGHAHALPGTRKGVSTATRPTELKPIAQLATTTVALMEGDPSNTDLVQYWNRLQEAQNEAHAGYLRFSQ